MNDGLTLKLVTDKGDLILNLRALLEQHSMEPKYLRSLEVNAANGATVARVPFSTFGDDDDFGAVSL